MITISDALIVTGTGLSLVGCWMCSWEMGLIGTGIVMGLAGRVVYGLNKRGAR